uniref:Uncharacterized protein n=1 Tax=Romanomermis culicivorax TaxID=13658 RepID=A0A915IZM3_ROMCU
MSLFTCLSVRKLICIFLLCVAFSDRLYGQQQPQSPGQFFPSMPAQPFGQQPPLGSGSQQPPTPNNFQHHTLEVNWHEPYNYALYCVGQSPVQDLRFICPTCGRNNTGSQLGGALPAADGRAPFAALQQQAQIDQLLFQHTKDMTSLMQYPVIKLVMLPITGEVWDKQRIQCVGYYPGALTPTGVRPNVTADTLISVQYVAKPQILDQLDRRPLFTGQGRCFQR